ncbi:MAG: diiron oxygenase [Schleiferiaceae bacterium]|jgi:hypothetical protein|nr:diiron oxygenase [Schleiferiaceae bacterium]
MEATLIKPSDEAKVERLIKLSETKALIPDKYVPWQDEEDGEWLMPETLVSLQGHPLYEELSYHQKRELGRHELSQVVYSYAWAEGIGCLTFSNRMVHLEPTSLEYKYLLKMNIEECRHQEMFVKLIEKVRGKTFSLPAQHFFMRWYMKNCPQSHRFLSILIVEIIADTYGKIIRKTENVFRPVRKSSQLHHIEEGRHIYYTKNWLNHFIDNASFFRRTTYSLVALSNVLLLKSLYVRREIFEEIGVKNPKKFTRAARKNLHSKFTKLCIDDVVSFVREIDGFNFVTKPIWKILLNVKP